MRYKHVDVDIYKKNLKKYIIQNSNIHNSETMLKHWRG